MKSPARHSILLIGTGKEYTRRRYRTIPAGFFLGTLTVTLIISLVTPAWSKTIHVPDDSTTIQAGIDGAVHGDTVLVANGVYTGEGNKNLDFSGKAIVVRSENGPEATVIDCENDGRGFIFQNGEGSDSMLEGFTIWHGCVDYGGGIKCDGSSPSINQCIIKENKAYFGGGIFCLYSYASFSQSMISKNSVHTYEAPEAAGGGLFSVNSSIAILNCVISNNKAEALALPPFHHWAWGGGICCDSATLTNCVFTGNESSSGIGGIDCDGLLSITNCILWHDLGGEIAFGPGGNSIVIYSNIQGGWPGEGNIDENPLFRDPENDDYHLMAIICGDSLNSPCIDAGDPSVLDDSLDCWHGLGTSRSDMGAYGGANSGWPTVVEEDEGEGVSVPKDFMLFQNYPNPFNSETMLRFQVVESGLVKIIIYNILGQELQVLVKAYRDAGQQSIRWDASGLQSGIYFARLEAGGHSQAIKMVLIK